MIKMCCDRCGEEIKGTTYYTISIHADDINPVPAETVTMATAINNIQNAFSIFNVKKQYCKDCKDKIEAFINNKE